MLLRKRLFEREPPNREAKSIYIFCEGAKREYQYFRYFREMDSRINIQVYRLNDQEDNSPRGLFEIAQKSIIVSEANPDTKYTFQPNDEVWIVLDVDKDQADSRKPQIEIIKDFCKNQKDWNMAQSNPCFEVWLYYHLFGEQIEFEGNDKCISWKRLVNEKIPGGFSSQKHPIFIGTAIVNAKDNYKEQDSEPQIGSSSVYLLGEQMLNILKVKIDKALMLIQDSE